MGTQVNLCIFIFIAINIILVSSKSIDEDLLQRLSSVPRIRVKRLTGNSTEIAPGDWPWLVRLKGHIPTKSFWGIPYAYVNKYCGGSIINKRWIMTAAHCFDGHPNTKNPKYWHVKVGEVIAHDHWYDRLLSYFGNDKVWSRHGQKLIVSPSYDISATWKDDIAVLSVEKDMPIDDNPNVAAVTLPDGSEGNDWPADNSGCVVKGWGCDRNGGHISDNAKAAIFPKLDNSDCEDNYGTDMQTRLCAGYIGADTGICQGDSGGPLVCPYGNSYRQAGIASFTSADKPEKFPGVFTKVKGFVPWILENTK